MPIQLGAVISISYSGPEQTDARGMNIRVPIQLSAVITISCSGPEATNGCRIYVHLSISSDGQDRTEALDLNRTSKITGFPHIMNINRDRLKLLTSNLCHHLTISCYFCHHLTISCYCIFIAAIIRYFDSKKLINSCSK